MTDQKRPGKYPVELRDRAVRMVFEAEQHCGSQWEAIVSVAEKLGPTAETVRKWVRRVEMPRVIVSCSGLGCGPERRRGDGEAIEEDDRSEAASGAVRSAGGALGGGGGTTQRRVGTVGS